MDLADHVRTSSNPTPTTVFLEDSAALIGIVIAATALVVHAATGSAVADGGASLMIGLLLIVVAVLLARRNAALMIDESTPPDVRDRLTGVLDDQQWILRVAELTAVWTGRRRCSSSFTSSPATVPTSSVISRRYG